MIERAHWPAAETLLRLVIEEKVRRSVARQTELDALQAMGWIRFKNSQAIVEAGRSGDLRERLQARWPGWEAEVNAARGAGLDVFSRESYAPGRRTIEVALGLDPDPITIEIIREILAKISGDRAALNLKIRNFHGRTAVIDIVDETAQSVAAFEHEVGELRSRLLTALGRLREKDAHITRLKTQLRGLAADVFLAGTPYQEMHAALLAIEILHFDQLTVTEKGDAVTLLSQLLDLRPGREAIAWREDRMNKLLLVIEDPLKAVESALWLIRHLASDRFDVRCGVSHGMVSFEPPMIGGGPAVRGRAAEEAIMLRDIAASNIPYAVVASGEFRDMLFDGSEHISFVPLPSFGAEPLSGAFGVNNLRN